MLHDSATGRVRSTPVQTSIASISALRVLRSVPCNLYSVGQHSASESHSM